MPKDFGRTCSPLITKCFMRSCQRSQAGNGISLVPWACCLRLTYHSCQSLSEPCCPGGLSVLAKSSSRERFHWSRAGNERALLCRQIWVFLWVPRGSRTPSAGRRKEFLWFWKNLLPLWCHFLVHKAPIKKKKKKLYMLNNPHSPNEMKERESHWSFTLAWTHCQPFYSPHLLFLFSVVTWSFHSPVFPSFFSLLPHSPVFFLNIKLLGFVQL